MRNSIWKLSYSNSLTQDRTHPFLGCHVLSFPVDVIVEAIDSGAHNAVPLISAHWVHIPKLTG